MMAGMSSSPLPWWISPWNSAVLDPKIRARLQDLRFQDAGHGFDPFGLHPEYVAFGLSLVMPVYRNWFRVLSNGIENIPAEGPAILAGNHSGTLPLDGMMLYVDVALGRNRVPRPVADHFVSAMPFIGTLFTRSGMVGGSRGNVRSLLESGELLMIFPEGVPGIGKPFSERYKLQAWRRGHAELAIRHGAPVVPVGIIGAEEQMPQIARLETLGKLLGLPYLPVPATPIPLPVRYHIYYGEPIPLQKDYRPQQADDPEAVREAAGRVKDAVEKLLARGLAERKGVFA